MKLLHMLFRMHVCMLSLSLFALFSPFRASAQQRKADPSTGVQDTAQQTAPVTNRTALLNIAERYRQKQLADRSLMEEFNRRNGIVLPRTREVFSCFIKDF